MGQLLLLGLAALLLLAGGIVSVARLRSEHPALRVAAKGCMYMGLSAATVALVWHTLLQRSWQPAADNFSALIWVAVLLGGFVMYIQRARPIRGLDWFVMPIVILLLVAAIVFGRSEFSRYKTVGGDTIVWLHWVSAYGGAVAFALAAAGGAMYVLTSRRLRQKKRGPYVGSLERLEHLMMTAVSLGFALLTIGLITGMIRMYSRNAHQSHAKLLLASLAWLVYAVVMHAPFNPRFRGRRAAMLSVFGFALMIGTLIVVQFVPGGSR